MEHHILIIEPRAIVRAGLRSIFFEDGYVTSIREGSAEEDLNFAENLSIDLVLVQQSIIKDITKFPPGKFVVIASELDMNMLKAAHAHKACGYFSENVTADLLRITLHLTDGSFLLDPQFGSYVMDYLHKGATFLTEDQIFSPREREIINLLQEGVDRRTIAKQLCIAESTLKTHIKNIARKREKACPSSFTELL